MTGNLRVVMVVIGLPTTRRPMRGVFNLRAAQQISSLVDLQLVFLRSWAPGRPLWAVRRRNGLRVTTLSLPQAPGLAGFNLTLLARLGWRWVRPLLAGADLVHSVSLETSGVLASHWSRRVGVRHVAQVIGSDLRTGLLSLDGHRLVESWHHHVHGVAAVCDTYREIFCARYPCVRNVRTVYRGTDLTLFHPSGPPSGPFVCRQPVRFLFLGGFPIRQTARDPLAQKQGLALLSTWREREERLHSLGASLVLAGPNSDIPYLRELRGALRYPEQVALGGLVNPADVPGLMRAAEVVLLPSMGEGLPNVAVEASGCGRAVVASTVGGVAEVVEHRVTGLLLEPEDRASWGDSLVWAAANEGIIREMGSRARRRAEERFDSRRFAPSMVALYDAALDEPIGPPPRQVSLPDGKRDLGHGLPGGPKL